MADETEEKSEVEAKPEKPEEKVEPKPKLKAKPKAENPPEEEEPTRDEIRREVVRRVRRDPDDDVDLDDAPDAWAEEERERLDQRVTRLEDARHKKQVRSFLEALPFLVIVGLVLFVKFAEQKGWKLPWQKSA